MKDHDTKKSKQNKSDVAIYLTTDKSTIWDLFNPGPYQNIAIKVINKYRIGLKLKAKMKYTPQDCFKMIVTELEKFPDHNDLNVYIDINMTGTMFYTVF